MQPEKTIPAPPARITPLSAPGFVLAVLLALLCAIPFLPFSTDSFEPFSLEFSLSSTVPGRLCLAETPSSAPLSEAQAAALPVVGPVYPVCGDNTRRPVRLPVSPGLHQAFRLSLPKGPGQLELSRPRILNAIGDPRLSFSIRNATLLGAGAITQASDDSLLIDLPASGAPALLELHPTETLRLHTPAVTLLWWGLRLTLPCLACLCLLYWLFLQRAPRRLASTLASSLATRPLLALPSLCALATLASSAPLLLPGTSLSEQSPHFAPALSATALTHQALLHEHSLPLWNRLDESGAALLGQGQAMLGDPLQLLLPVLFDNASWAWTAKFLLSKLLFSLGLGLLLWRLTRHLPSAVLLGFSSAFLGLWLQALHSPTHWSVCYLPWLLLAWHAHASLASQSSPSPRCFLRSATLLLLASWCTLCSGAPEQGLAFLVGGTLAGLGILFFATEDSLSRRLRLAAWALAALLVLALLSCPLWLSHLETLRRTLPSSPTAVPHQLSASELPGLFDSLLANPAQTQSGDLARPSANYLLLGGLLYLLVTLHRGYRSRPALPLLALALPLAALVAGLVPAAWYQLLGLQSLFGHPDSALATLLLTLLAVLAGLGFHAAWTRRATSEARGDTLRLALLLALLTAACLSQAQSAALPVETPASNPFGPLLSFRLFHIVAAPLALLGLLHLLQAPARGAYPVINYRFILAVLCLGLLLWRQALHTGLGFESLTHQLSPVPAVSTEDRQCASFLAHAASSRAPERLLSLRQALPASLIQTYRFEQALPTSSRQSPHYRELLSALRLAPADLAALRPAQLQPDFIDALRFLNTGHLLVPSASLWPGFAETAAADWSLGRSPADAALLELDAVWPRAFLVTRIHSYTTMRELAAAIFTSDSPFAAVEAGQGDLPASISLPQTLPDDPIQAWVAADNYRLSSNSTRFEINAPSPGFVVLQETWIDREFRAYVDGKKTPYFRVNHAFKAVQIDTAGSHVVEFRYQPRNWIPACIAAAAGLLLLLGAWLLVGLRPR